MEQTGKDRVERRLAAILAADVAGYSRLMGIDEEGTLARLKAHQRALVEPKVAEHHGRS
jgi:adenylate cyclase